LVGAPDSGLEFDFVQDGGAGLSDENKKVLIAVFVDLIGFGVDCAGKD